MLPTSATNDNHNAIAADTDNALLNESIPSQHVHVYQILTLVIVMLFCTLLAVLKITKNKVNQNKHSESTNHTKYEYPLSGYGSV